MTFFDVNEKIEFIATQNFHYDSYAGYQYYLERVDVNGKRGLVCVEEVQGCGTHSTVILEPVYNDIQIRKISTPKANFDRYVVVADGKKVGDFTMVLNAWVPYSKN